MKYTFETYVKSIKKKLNNNTHQSVFFFSFQETTTPHMPLVRDGGVESTRRLIVCKM